MIKHSLICLLFDNPNGRFKTLRYNQDNSIEKIIEVYRHNLKNLQYILDYCHQQKINSYRISCDLFPLLGAQKFEDQINIVLEVLNNEIKNIKAYNIELSLHPDQFILLSSLNQNVNKNSIYFLNRWAQIKLPINLINIHIGSKAAGFDKHKEIFIDQFDKLSAAAQNKLSIENDEKNYSIKEIINIAKEAKIKIVPDFHHERCYQKRLNSEKLSLKEHYSLNKKIDENIFNNIDLIFNSYKKETPLFHLSSPRGGWQASFKEQCSHADYIDLLDYPLDILSFNKDIRLDIEAKAKEKAIIKLNKQLKKIIK